MDQICGMLSLTTDIQKKKKTSKNYIYSNACAMEGFPEGLKCRNEKLVFFLRIYMNSYVKLLLFELSFLNYPFEVEENVEITVNSNFIVSKKWSGLMG